ncbi:MAG: LuxR C-terminal-related transcriptional regulator, partial [Mucinivorans sp.]
KNRMNVSLVYRLSLPIMIAGFIIVAAFFGQRTPGSVLLIGIGYELFDILSWILFSYIAHKKGTSSTSYIFGFGVGFTFIGMAAGYILSSILGPLVAQGDVQISAVALVSVLCLAVVAFLVLPESVLSSIPAIQHSSKKVEEFSPVPEIEAQAECPPFDKACQAIATHYGLTPRESEVLEFLARGRTLPIVARDLQIAKNTARSHIEKIYQKLGVHKQQDLIDLVESWQSKEFPEKRQASL